MFHFILQNEFFVNQTDYIYIHCGFNKYSYLLDDIKNMDFSMKACD